MSAPSARFDSVGSPVGHAPCGPGSRPGRIRGPGVGPSFSWRGPVMNAEILAIGSELVSGQTLDTNSQWLSRRLGELGIATQFITVLGDDLDANVSAFRIAAGRADLVVASGGLGPTQDD